MAAPEYARAAFLLQSKMRARLATRAPGKAIATKRRQTQMAVWLDLFVALRGRQSHNLLATGPSRSPAGAVIGAAPRDSVAVLLQSTPILSRVGSRLHQVLIRTC